MSVRKLFIFMVASSCWAAATFSQSQRFTRESFAEKFNPQLTAVPFLTIAPDSRAGAMGDAGVASTPDVHSQHWNAAKYAFIESDAAVSLSYAPWLRQLGINDINLLYLVGYKKLDERQTISGSLRYFSLGEIIFTDIEGIPQGNYNPNEFAIDAGYSLQLSERFAGNISFRFIRSDLTGGRSFSGSGESKAGIAGGADLGFYYQNNDIELSDRDSELAWGIQLSNMGTKISYNENKTPDFLPINMRLGGRLTTHMDEYNSFSFMVDLNKYLIPTPPFYYDADSNEVVKEDPSVAFIKGYDPDVSVPLGMIRSFYDAPGGIKEELKEIMYSLGVEYMYRDQFAIRAGYFHEAELKGNRKYVTLGVGIRLNVFGLDFSYLAPTTGQNNPLANTVRFTLSFNFDGNQ
jgi:hypothetical protein